MNASFSRDQRLVPCAGAPAYAAVAERALATAKLPSLLPVLTDPVTAERLCALLPGTRVAAPAPGEDLDAVSRLIDAAPKDAETVLLAERGTPETAPAAFYAAATGRRLVLVDDISDFAHHLADSRSAMIAAHSSRFSKAYLRGLLEWSQSAQSAPGSLGILTGRTVSQISWVVAKLIAMRRRHAEGLYLPGHGEQATEFEIIGAHGNEIHLGFREDSVLCGRRADLSVEGQGFDCGRGCPLPNRVDAATLTAATVFLMSCDGFTPTGGIASEDQALLFRLLDGPCAAVLAPYKHVQANEPLMDLIEATALSGYSLGEIAHFLKARVNDGVLPDYGFLVLGDPDLHVVAPTGPNLHDVTLSESAHGQVIRGELRSGCRAVTVTLPSPERAGPLAVMPISANMRVDGGLFVLGAGTGGQLDVTLFRATQFAPGPFEVALLPAAAVAEDAIAAGADALTQSELIEAVFDRDAGFDEAKKSVYALLGTAAAFPRPIEALDTQSTLILFDAVMHRRLARLRAAAADRVLATLAERRIWISQDYAALYPDVRRAGPRFDHNCPHCGNEAVVWRYADRITRRPTRYVSICNRCGITSDIPTGCPVEVEMTSLERVDTPRANVVVTLTNRSGEPQGISLALQVNEYEPAGVLAENNRAELELPPGTSLSHRVSLIFPEGFQDDILSIQLFVVDDQLGLSFVSQKVLAQVRPRPDQAPEAAAHSDSPV